MKNEKAKHTPGPWSADQYERILKSVWPNNTNNKANAALIASAPELLAALERIVDLAGWQDFWAGDRPGIKADLDAKYISALDGARAAVAKAKGDK